MPKWDGKLYAGDSKRAGITRAQSNESIPANDPRFDDFVAMSYEDFRRFVAVYVYGCQTWKPGVKMMDGKESQAVFKVILDQWQAEAPKQ